VCLTLLVFAQLVRPKQNISPSLTSHHPAIRFNLLTSRSCSTAYFGGKLGKAGARRHLLNACQSEIAACSFSEHISFTGTSWQMDLRTQMTWSQPCPPRKWSHRVQYKSAQLPRSADSAASGAYLERQKSGPSNLRPLVGSHALAETNRSLFSPLIFPQQWNVIKTKSGSLSNGRFDARRVYLPVEINLVRFPATPVDARSVL